MNTEQLAAEAWQEWESEAYALGAGFLDRVRGCYPVADDMPDLYNTGAMLAVLVGHLVADEARDVPADLRKLAQLVLDQF